MKEILLINPKKRVTKKKKTKKRAVRAKKREVPIMARKRKTTRRRKPRRNPSTSRKPRRNPSVRKICSGLNVQGALKNVLPTQIGMFAAKFAAKRFGDFGATEIDPESWNWASYLKGGLGAFVAALGAQALKPAWGQKVLEGGINLMAYKVIENELIAGNETAERWLGQGPVYEDEGGAYMIGQDGSAYPVDERHRLPEVAGAALEPVGSLGRLEPVGPLGATDDPFAKAFLSE